MNWVLSCYLLWFLATSAAHDEAAGAPAPLPVDAELELQALEELRRTAIKEGDMRTVDSIYADDFSGIVGSGQIVNKEQLMALFKRNDPRISFTTDEVNVRVFGDAAVFTGRLMGRVAGGEVVSASRFTHVFVKLGGRWRCVAGQSTAIRDT